MSNDKILKQVIDYYLTSRDFNGLPIRIFKLPLVELKDKLSELIKDGDISLVFEEQHPNPHVKCPSRSRGGKHKDSKGPGRYAQHFDKLRA